MRHVVNLLLVILLSNLALSISLRRDANAQGASPSGQPSTQSTASTTAALLKPEQLDQLVAPIALYPDTLLAEVIMASTYPLEVIEGERWVKANASLKGEQLKAAADQQTWDQSIKSLTVTPDVLAMMSSKLDWTQKLGDAVLAQQADVMDAVQRLRLKAQASDKLKTTKEQTVTKTQEGSKEVIVIEPAIPDTIYVPYYDPAVVYGGWPYPAYPPYYFPVPGYIAGAAIATGLAFGAGYTVGRWVSGGYRWGGGMNWGGGNININRPINLNNNNINSNNNWQHNPDHRHGVQYHNDAVRQKFGGNNNARPGRDQRMDFRGRDGQQVLKPGGADRPGAGQRPEPNRAGDRQGDRGGDRSGNRQAGDRSRGDIADRAKPGNRGGGVRDGNRGGGGQNALAQMNKGNAARQQANRGQASLGARATAARPQARPAMQARPAGGGGFAQGGGGGMRGGGGGRRR